MCYYFATATTMLLFDPRLREKILGSIAPFFSPSSARATLLDPLGCRDAWILYSNGVNLRKAKLIPGASQIAWPGALLLMSQSSSDVAAHNIIQYSRVRWGLWMSEKGPEDHLLKVHITMWCYVSTIQYRCFFFTSNFFDTHNHCTVRARVNTWAPIGAKNMRSKICVQTRPLQL